MTDATDRTFPSGEVEIAEFIRALPTPAPMLARITAVITTGSSSAKDVADVLKSDPAIVGKILRLANSAYFGLPKSVSNVQHAVALLGQKRVFSLVMSASITGSLRIDPAKFDLPGFWFHSTAVGMIAESIARHLQRYRTVDAETYFSASILHDIGKLIALQCRPGSVREAVTASRIANIPYCEAEVESMRHTALGELLAREWHFPDDLASVIARHHLPGAALPGHERITCIAHIADSMAHLIGFGSFAGEPGPRIDDLALATVSLPFERLRVIAENLLERKSELESVRQFYS